ncbi:hypothetical protein RYX36_028317 [Vicia faba]
MAKYWCDFRLLLFVAALVFIYIQMRLFTTQSQYADRLALAIQAENHCTTQMQSLIDQVSSQQGRILALQEERTRLDQECRQIKSLVQDLERKEVRRLIDKVQVPVAAVVIMACNRADYLERTINSVLKYQRPISSRFPLFVSQDGSNSDVKSKALSYDELSYMQYSFFSVEVIEFEQCSSCHYKWALGQLFYKHNFSRVIILEDDMEIAPDFFDYFEAMATLLDKDKSIMAVSSWNDNGQKQFVHDPCSSDPCSSCRPIAGSSLGQFFKQYLEPIRLNEVQVDWKSTDLSYLLEDKYNIHFANNIKKAKPVSGADIVQKTHNIDGDVRIKYNDQWDFENIAQQFGVFQEWKDGVPRTAYKGVVVFRYQTTRRVFLIGPESLKLLQIEYLDS